MIKKIEDKNGITLYEGYGYRMTIEKITNTLINKNKTLINVIPLYPDMIIYPNIEFLPVKNEFIAKIPEAFSLKAGDEKMWIDGIKNTYRFINEANKIINEIMNLDSEK